MMDLVHMKNFMDEDFVNYKKCSMFIGFPNCSFKCCKECGMNICQNSELVNAPMLTATVEQLWTRFSTNPLSEAIVCGGLEPFDSYDELFNLIRLFRDNAIKDPFVIYTGYNKEEIQDKIDELKRFKNIIIKFGRFIPNQPSHYDEVLGVELASPNQYAEVIS